MKFSLLGIAKIATDRSERPAFVRASLAHLLAGAFEILGYELPFFVVRLGEMVGVDKRIATPESAKCLFPPGESNRIVSDPPAWAHI